MTDCVSNASNGGAGGHWAGDPKLVPLELVLMAQLVPRAHPASRPQVALELYLAPSRNYPEHS